MGVEAPARTLPLGFRENAAGLVVPEALSREREVWTKDEWRLLERAVKLLGARQMRVYFGCPDDRCRSGPIQRFRLPDGSIALRCAHRDRVLTKAV